MGSSLFDTIKQNGSVLNVARPSGTDATGTSSQLAASAGLPSAPTAPVQAASIGATPDQAKMAATPNGLRGQSNALLRAVKGPRDLQTALRERQVNSTQTAAEAAAGQVAQQLAGFGSLSAAVPGLVQKAMLNAANQADKTGFIPEQSVLDQKYVQGSAVSKDQFTAAVAAVGAGGLSPQDEEQQLALINQGMGRKTANEVSADEVKNFFGSPVNAADDATAAAVGAVQSGKTPADVTLGQLDPSSFGQGMTWDQLGKDLGGLSADAVQKMTVQDLGNALKTMQAKGYSTEAQWRSVLSDPTSSMQERTTARQMLQGLGAQGVTQTEATVAKVTQQVQAANLVTVNGKQQTIGDALSSDTTKALISEILQNPSGSAAQQNHELLQWATAHAASLQGILSAVDPAQVALAKVGADNAALFAPLGSAAKDAAMKFTGADLDTVSTLDLRKDAPPVVTAISTMDPVQGTAFSSIMGAWPSGGNPPIANLAGMSLDKMKSLGWFDPTTNAQIVTGMKVSAAVQKLKEAPSSSPDEVTQAFGLGTAASVSKTNEVLHLATAAGITLSGPFAKGLSVGALTGLAKGSTAYDPTTGAPPADYAGSLKGTTDQLATFVADPKNAAVASIIQEAQASSDGRLDDGAWGRILTPATQAASAGDLSALDKLQSVANSLGQKAAGAVMQATATATISAVDILAKPFGGTASLIAEMSDIHNASDPAKHAQIDQKITTMLQQAGGMDPRIQAQVRAIDSVWGSTKAKANDPAYKISQMTPDHKSPAGDSADTQAGLPASIAQGLKTTSPGQVNKSLEKTATKLGMPH